MNAPDGTERRRMRPREAAVIALPNGFTLANLFFGIFGIVAASRGDFDAAARFIVFGAVADTLDGRIARATKSGSRFGEELDSLVDAISFGTAPALIMYFAVFQSTRWEWIFCFFFTACAVMRLARFNVMQAGRKTTHFQGLPSPAAGGILATYYWFSQTSLYTETVVADLPWHQMLRFLMLGLGMLMISNVQYAKFPVVNFRSLQGILGFLLVVGTLIGVIFLPKQFFFPAGMAYVLYGIGRTVFLGLLDRLPGRDPSGENEEDEEDPETAPPRRRRRRRRSQRNPTGPDTGREDKPA
ncbi:MAG: CDP-diacylglycerol--serine O-phosphatidyltransferase [Gemmatimonas sp.]|jgi:CDP-diacylglycerol--serine O-phosphatidyltransferase|uniref:CDP-diacylglycerol--serine O-phosphatidyltransferase n=1 Tax=Gemmatimonas sp. TaxID=1962908 RepID=UPI0025B9D4E8|nr:CDP-diacylglycerol--serine O-phosphatidyltransferase [Gemmatimonas sp.]MCA2982391.1 CDP-diacylglycerol--serine O-phosphatidyltransferase [Gemmatimonas sp.]MCA2994140.1 CDP-diacylglycerol--serine O-phosphatidyltransferase [Gemmatimonas sp.]MCE2952333.1 CDP-diacylglycerol--serine O-phosphatidyltransferase [Gemmatimonas sp.]